MAIIKNHFYNIVFYQDDFIDVLMKVEDHLDDMHPQNVKDLRRAIDGIQSLSKENPYNDLLDRMYSLLDHLQIKKERHPFKGEITKVSDISHFMEDVEKQVDELEETIEEIEKEKAENEEALFILNRLKEEKVSLDDIQNLNYITLRFGKMPLNEMNKLQYYKTDHFFLKELTSDERYMWLVYCGAKQDMGEVDNIFSALNFETIQIPEFAHGQIEDALKEIDQEKQTMEDYIKVLHSRIDDVKNKNVIRIMKYFNEIIYLKGLYDDCQFVVDLETKASIYLFTSYDKKEMDELFKDVSEISINELPTNIFKDYGIIGNLDTKNSQLFEPFESFFKFIPGDRFDPTPAMALSMMVSAFLFIGDLGLGAIMILLSKIRKTKKAGLLESLGYPILFGGLLTGKLFYIYSLYELPFAAFTKIGGSTLGRFIIFVVFNFVMYIVLNICKKCMKVSYKGGV